MLTAHDMTLGHPSEDSGLHPAGCPELPEPAAGVLAAGRYRLVRRVGEGGMASVWLAQDTLLERECALKLLHARYVGNDELVAGFEREARTTASLRSAHVVQLFDRGVWRGLPYMTLEFLAGENLHTRLIRRERLDAEATYRVLAQVARGLACIHAEGIVHRDLKPSNVVLTPSEDGEVAKIIDFGVALDFRFESAVSPPHALIGTPAYMSPEQALGLAVDWRSDLWSLGVLAFECLTGGMLFESDGATLTTNKVLYQPLPKVTDLVPELPPAVEVWFDTALARERHLRFQSAKALADAFGAAIGAGSVLTVPDVLPRAERALPNAGEPQRMVAAVPPAQPTPATRLERPRPMTRAHSIESQRRLLVLRTCTALLVVDCKPSAGRL
jgi:serine/threonine protein kinase